MQEKQKLSEDAVIIGDLAKIYNISKRTLRLYHEMGLLVPDYVDYNTGYRYYSPAQFPRLDMILQMKSVGLSLVQIKQMLDQQNLSLFEAVLGEQIDKLDEKIAECRMHRDALSRQLESCKFIRNPPVLDKIFVEYIPRRSAFLSYDIESYDLRGDYPNQPPWQNALDQMKSVFMQNNVPLALFQQVGGIVRRQDLMRSRYICSGVFIQFGEGQNYGLPMTTVESGIYVCLHRRYEAMNGIEESWGIQLLLDHIEQNGYKIKGDYIAQVIAEDSVFGPGKNIIVKHQIPIEFSL